jgi:RND family efflux transporter MFP subunit
MSPTMLLGRVVLPGIGLILAVALFWQAVRNVPAGTESELLPAVRAPSAQRDAPSSPGRITAEGRVVAYPDAEVTVGTEVLGTILRMPAREKQAVHKGDLLLELRADEVRASLREAHARRIEADADLQSEQERVRLDRILPALAGREVRPLASRPDMSAVVARRDAAKAAVERLEAELARYRIVAPIDGVIVARHADLGETVNAASPLVTIVDLNRLRVEAEINEFDIARVSPGARATIAAEGFRGRRWRGVVEEIADLVAPRQTRPEDPGRPTDVRILPVKIALREATPLKLGQRVEVEILDPEQDH